MANGRVCSIPDCGKPHEARGWCKAHFLKWRRHGDPLAGRKRTSYIRRSGECSVSGCDRGIESVGFCRAHYKRWKRHGNPLGGSTFEGEPRKYFEDVVLTFEGDDCLKWPYTRNWAGYGIMSDQRVHRMVCFEIHGEPPTPEHAAAHSCGKGHLGCVNPKHLRWDTHAGNMADTIAHGTSRRGERSPNAKLNESAVREIRVAYHSGSNPRELGIRFGVSRTTVINVANRRSWAWLE